MTAPTTSPYLASEAEGGWGLVSVVLFDRARRPEKTVGPFGSPAEARRWAARQQLADARFAVVRQDLPSWPERGGH